MGIFVRLFVEKNFFGSFLTFFPTNMIINRRMFANEISERAIARALILLEKKFIFHFVIKICLAFLCCQQMNRFAIILKLSEGIYYRHRFIWFYGSLLYKCNKRLYLVHSGAHTQFYTVLRIAFDAGKYESMYSFEIVVTEGYVYAKKWTESCLLKHRWKKYVNIE